MPEARGDGEGGKWLKTPEGWARAKLLFHTLQGPPKRGSVRESALLLFVMMQDNIQHAQLRALAQILVDKTEGMKAFQEYMEIAFPYLKTVKSREVSAIMDVMRREAAIGPLVITKKHEKTIDSRLKRAKRVTAPAPESTGSVSPSLLQKMGPSIPWKR